MFRDSGVFEGSPDDLRNGFVHLSGAARLRKTVEKHFSGAAELVLVAIDAAALGPLLRWEVSRGGAKFPHLYGSLPMGAVRGITPLRRESDGIFLFPPEIP